MIKLQEECKNLKLKCLLAYSRDFLANKYLKLEEEHKEQTKELEVLKKEFNYIKNRSITKENEKLRNAIEESCKRFRNNKPFEAFEILLNANLIQETKEDE